MPVVWLIAVVIMSSNISIVSSETEDGFSGLIASAESLIDLNKPLPSQITLTEPFAASPEMSILLSSS